MQMSKLFIKTLRDDPSEAEVTSHKLLLRAGFIRQLAAGIFINLPFAKRSTVKIENIIKEEIEKIGGLEMTMPVIHPADIWKESKRWYQIGGEMGRFKDRNDHDMVLAMTHEEVVAYLVRKEIRSYKQLPSLIYHIQTKWRDDPRPRAGLIRVREFVMKDSYSLDETEEGLDKQYKNHYRAYFNIAHRCDLPVIAVKSDAGMMGGNIAHEFIYLTPIGEDTLMICKKCGFSANRQIAGFFKQADEKEQVKPVEEVETPGVTTIEDLAKFLNIPESKTAKVVFKVAEIKEEEEYKDRLVMAVIRGDMEVSDTKLVNVLQARSLRPAQDEEIVEKGTVPGYASPVGLKDVMVVVDDLIPASTNLVAGANQEGYHLLNVNYDRDYKADITGDIAQARDGDSCPQCQAPLQGFRGVEIGNIFKLGTRYSDYLGCNFLDKNGKWRPIVMGSYGIGVGRMLASIVEEHNDKDGICWPISVAPFHLYLISIGDKGKEIADSVYEQLWKEGIEVLYDDRDDSPGIKFKDADLIGLPLRMTIGDRSLQKGGAELKLRREKESIIIPVDEITEKVKELKNRLEKELSQKVAEKASELVD
ncbi:MAG: proline--tRNA ligase [Candidatus Aminicenantes bacterium]|nr:proline--tRNA ligase [Candidatus Aminicenantes bacterium]